MVNVMAIIVGLLLASASIVAVVAQDCRLKNEAKCYNGSTIALTVVLSLLVAVTSIYWLKPVFMGAPHPVMVPSSAGGFV